MKWTLTGWFKQAQSNKHEFEYKVLEAGGDLSRSGEFAAGSMAKAFEQLSNHLKGKPCGSDGPIKEIGKEKQSGNNEYTADVFGEEGTCGYLIVNLKEEEQEDEGIQFNEERDG